MSRILTRACFQKMALPLLLSLFSFSAGAWEFCANADPRLSPITGAKANTWMQVEKGSVLCIECKGTATPNKARTNCRPTKTCQKEDSKGGCAANYTKLADRISTFCLKDGDDNGTPSRCAKTTTVAETKSTPPAQTSSKTKTAKSSSTKKETAKQNAEAPAKTEVAAKPASPDYAPSIRSGVSEQKSKEKTPLAKVEPPKPSLDQQVIEEAYKADGFATRNGEVRQKIKDINGDWASYDPKSKKAYNAKGEEVEIPRDSGTLFYSADGKTSYKTRADWVAAGGTAGGRIVNYTEGTTIYYDQKGNAVLKTDKDGNVIARNDEAKRDATKAKKIDQCEKSQAIDPKYVCDGTYSVSKLTDIGNQVLTSSGRNVINELGAASARKAQTGKDSGNLESSAKMAKTGFTYESIMTAANLSAATTLGRKSRQHAKNAADMQDGAVKQGIYEQNRSVDEGATINDVRDYRGAIVEQNEARNAAKEGAYKAAVVGIASMANAVVAKKQQVAMEKAAKTQRQIEAKTAANGVTFDGTGINTIGIGNGGSLDQLEGTPNAGTDPSSINTNTDDTQTIGSGSPSLGSGSDSAAGDDSGPKGPIAGKFKPSEGGGAAGGGGTGGGGGGAAGGGSSGAPISTEESKAQYAAEFGTKERYESGGSPGAGAKGKGAGGKEDGGLDLNGLLAQFLPKDETDMGPKNGILDYQGFGGGRAPAAEEAPSYLDKNADLFQRIHETMSEKNRKGHVGI